MLNEPSAVVSVTVYPSRRTVQPSGRSVSKGAVDTPPVDTAAESTNDLWGGGADKRQCGLSSEMGRTTCANTMPVPNGAQGGSLNPIAHDVLGPAPQSTVMLALTAVPADGEGT